MWRTSPQSLIHPFHRRLFLHTHSLPPWCCSHGLEGSEKFYFVTHQLPEELDQVRLEPPGLGFLPLTVPVKGGGLQELHTGTLRLTEIFSLQHGTSHYTFPQQKLPSSSPETALQPPDKGYNAVVSGPSTTDSFLCRAPDWLLLALTGSYKRFLERNWYATDEQNKQNDGITALVFDSSMESSIFLTRFYGGFCSLSLSAFFHNHLAAIPL